MGQEGEGGNGRDKEEGGGKIHFSQPRANPKAVLCALMVVGSGWVGRGGGLLGLGEGIIEIWGLYV